MSQQQTEHRVYFTKEMKSTHTILIPDMLPLHFKLLRNVLRQCGYKAELLQNQGPQIAQLGLKYVHNDTCYPALLVIGQMIDALQSGRYDLDHIALMISQTGGGCRASNYIHLLRKALKKAGMGQIPVISLSANGMESNSGFQLTLPMLRKMLAAMVYGDELMLLRNQTTPYQLVEGAAEDLAEQWVVRLTALFEKGQGYSLRQSKPLLLEIARSFEAIPYLAKPKIKVGVVGEIYVKYASLGNNNLEAFLRRQDCEYLIPGVLGFLFYCVDNQLEDVKLYGGSRARYGLVYACLRYLMAFENAMIAAVGQTRFLPPGPYQHKKGLAKGVIGYGSKMGEGWLLTAEMLELVDLGYPNIICTQPFGCLPNHINGRGMLNKIKRLVPSANIVAIDYDPGAARVNQENRIKLMLASAKEAELAERQTAAQTEPEAEAEPSAAGGEGELAHSPT